MKEEEALSPTSLKISKTKSGEVSTWHKVTKDGDLQTFTRMLERCQSENIDINSRDQFGETVLHLACFCNRLEMVRKLLEKDTIDVNSTDVFGRTPLFLAARNGYEGT